MSKKRVVKVYQTQQIPTKTIDNRVLYGILGVLLLLTLILLGLFFNNLLTDHDDSIAVDAPYSAEVTSLPAEEVASDATS